jgi:hypothetical protein
MRTRTQTRGLTTYESGLQDELTILVVSANLESRRAVSKIVEALSVQVIPCPTLVQTKQVLSLQRPNLIFCDEEDVGETTRYVFLGHTNPKEPGSSEPGSFSHVYR